MNKDILQSYRRFCGRVPSPEVPGQASGRRRTGPGRVSDPGRFLAVLMGAVVFLAVGPAGCGNETGEGGPVVLTVGDQAFDLLDFEQAFWAYQVEQEVPADTSALREFVPVYADRALLEVVAEEELPELPLQPADRLEEFREKTLVEALRDKEYGHAWDVSSQRLDKAYERLGRRLKLRYMFLTDEEEAKKAVQALKQGGVFDRVARNRSEDERTRDQGGDLGWLDYYDLDVTVRDKVFSLPVGGLGGPYPWSGGWQIFKAEDEKPNPARGTLQAERAELEAGIQSLAVMEARKDYEDALLRKYEYQTDPAQVTWMTVFLRDKTAGMRRLGDPGVSLDGGMTTTSSQVPWTSNPIPPADSARVLATYDPPQGRVHPILIIDQLMTHPPLGWPRFQDNRDVEDLLRELVLERLEIRDALAQGMDQDPVLIREIEEKEKEIRTRYFYRTEVRSKVRATEEDAEAYYQANLNLYQQPERRRFVAANSRLWDNAVEASSLLRRGMAVEEIQARQAPADTSFKATTSEGTPLLTYGQSPALDEIIFNLPVNGVSDPIPVGPTFTVVKLIEIQPSGPTPLEEVMDEIQRDLTESRADSTLRVMLEEKREKHPLEIHWDAVWKARLKKPEAPGF